MKELYHLARCWAIEPDFLSNLSNMTKEYQAGLSLLNDGQLQKTSFVKIRGDIAIISLQGIITPRMDIFTYFMGGTPLDCLARDFQTAIDDDNIKGILFDKDGTLIDFFSLWLGAAKAVVIQFLKENELSEEVKERVFYAMGIENGEIDPYGGLAYKSYSEIALDITDELSREQIYLDSRKVRMQLERLFAEYVTESQAQYVETADIKAVLDSLKQRNIWIGLATADTVPSAKNCLKRLEVLEKFDYVGADDGVLRPKPEADMFLEFQKKFGLKPQEIAVVGDTYNDIRFARENGGVAIGVLSGVSQEADFCGEADYILNSVGELPQLLEQI